MTENTEQATDLQMSSPPDIPSPNETHNAENISKLEKKSKESRALSQRGSNLEKKEKKKRKARRKTATSIPRRYKLLFTKR